jgi:hypothetical protein
MFIMPTEPSTIHSITCREVFIMSISTESVHSGGYVLIRYEGMIGGDDVDQGHAVMKKGSEGTWLDTGLDAPKKF